MGPSFGGKPQHNLKTAKVPRSLLTKQKANEPLETNGRPQEKKRSYSITGKE